MLQSMMATRQLLNSTGFDCLVQVLQARVLCFSVVRCVSVAAQPVSPAAVLECLCKCIEDGFMRKAVSPIIATRASSRQLLLQEAAFVSSSQSLARQAHVLLVDDSALNVRVLVCFLSRKRACVQRRVGKMLLSKLSLHVDVAGDGMQAFEVQHRASSVDYGGDGGCRCTSCTRTRSSSWTATCLCAMVSAAGGGGCA